MASRIPSHQLSNGLYVSGRPNPHPHPHHLNHPVPALPPPAAAPFTVADAKNSGQLAKKMLDTSSSTLDHQNLPPLKPSRSSTSSSSQPNSNSFRSGPHSGPIKTSGPMLQPTGLITSGPHSGPKKASGPMLQPTGLITSGPLGSSAGHHHEPGPGAGKLVYGPAVTNLNDGQVRLGIRVSRAVMWVVLVAAAMVVVVGAFLMAAVERKDVVVVAVVVGGVLVAVVVVGVWNCGWKEKGLVGLFRRCPCDELRGAVDGQYAKVTGVVTCGSIPLESSFQKVPRCVYVSTELYEYRGWGGKTANPKHRFFSWGCRHVEKYVADFYISDFQSGFRAQVKAGYGVKVAPFVKPSTVVNVTKENRDLSPSFLEWLTDRSLSSDDRIMRLEEGYIKEGSTVTVMGVVRRHGNALMIVPPGEPVSTGCQWARCLLPMYIEGLILTCDESQTADVIPV